MVDLLLGLLYSTRTGDLEMLLECVRDTTGYTFACDNKNYARYLKPWLAKCSSLKQAIQRFVKN